MDHLDLSLIRETNEYWFEDIDFTCPTCHGEGEIEDDDGESDFCPDCEGSPDFEIMWDTAFSFEKPYTMEFEEARSIAWKLGWLLFEYNGQLWIAAGSCGYDFTWLKALVFYRINGFIDRDYALQMSRGGYSSVSDEDRAVLARECADTLRGFVTSLSYDIKEMDEVANMPAGISDIYNWRRMKSTTTTADPVGNLHGPRFLQIAI